MQTAGKVPPWTLWKQFQPDDTKIPILKKQHTAATNMERVSTTQLLTRHICLPTRQRNNTSVKKVSVTSAFTRHTSTSTQERKCTSVTSVETDSVCLVVTRTPVCPHRREATPVWTLWEDFQSLQSFQNTPAYPLWREANVVFSDFAWETSFKVHRCVIVDDDDNVVESLVNVVKKESFGFFYTSIGHSNKL